jgi:hypothetical protein
MNMEELEKALDLQKRAYALLLWIGKHAQQLLDQQALSSSTLCIDCLKRHGDEFPTELRPGSSELDGFAKMLTSFFDTSFHLEGGDGSDARLVRGRKFKDGRNRKYAQGRAEQAAAELSRIAVASLAQDEAIAIEDEAVSAILKDDAVASMVSLWAYGCELVRRSQFSSQGPAVHRLWLELDENKRKRLNAEQIWKARSILVEALRRKGAQYE